jgi:hypothetical protein
MRKSGYNDEKQFYVVGENDQRPEIEEKCFLNNREFL